MILGVIVPIGKRRKSQGKWSSRIRILSAAASKMANAEDEGEGGEERPEEEEDSKLPRSDEAPCVVLLPLQLLHLSPDINHAQTS